jgi:hypothetical protein
MRRALQRPARLLSPLCQLRPAAAVARQQSSLAALPAEEALDSFSSSSSSSSAALSTPSSTSWKGVKRFYTRIGVREAPGSPGSWEVLIEGRPLRSNAAQELRLPSEALAMAIGGEFAAQGEVIVPATTPIYNLASTAVDTYGSEDAAGAADYEAFVRATRLATFDQLADRVGATGSSEPAGAAAAAASSNAGILEAARSLEADAPEHSSLDSGRAGSAGLSSSGASGTAKLRDLMLDSLETDSVCYRVDWDTGDATDKQLRKRQNK